MVEEREEGFCLALAELDCLAWVLLARVLCFLFLCSYDIFRGHGFFGEI